MEATQSNAARFGRPMYRDRRGHEGGGQLYIARRERDFTRGLLSEMGHSNDYLVFQPSGFFVRVLGDGVLRLNAALSDFRGQALDHVLSLEGEPTGALCRAGGAHRGDARPAVRPDRVLQQGLRRPVPGSPGRDRAGSSGQASEGSQRNLTAGRFSPRASSEASAAVFAAAPGEADVFAGLRRRNVEQGILTDFGRDQGCVAFQPCPFYGRFMSEIAYTLNDALRRMEGQTSYYIVDGNGEVLRRYYLELKSGMAALRGDLDGIIAFCRRKVS